jgi:hypothetical protein
VDALQDLYGLLSFVDVSHVNNKWDDWDFFGAMTMSKN